jgi:exonuclease SbcD
MKILHTSDWHLGKRLESFSRLEEQKEVMDEICEIADNENVDAVLIAGDLFDTFNPPTEAIDLFYKTLKRLANNGKRPVIAIAGNHDSPAYIESPDPLARECGIVLTGYPISEVPFFELDSGLKVIKSEEGFLELAIPGQEYPLRILHTAYANEYRLKKYLGVEDPEEEMRKTLQEQWAKLADIYCDDKGVNVLVSHLYFMKKGGEKVEEPESEKPILHLGGAQAIYTENIPRQIQYTALGHLHRKQIVSEKPCPVVYCGSPISYSFSEANQDKYILIIDAAPGQSVDIQSIKLNKGKALTRKRFESVFDAVEWLEANPNVLVELTMVSDNFLSASDRKQINDAHDGIVTLIPEVKNIDFSTGKTTRQIDLKQDMIPLFKQYFSFKNNGQEPGEELLEILKEVIAEN